MMQKALELDPKPAVYYNNLGFVYYLLGELDKAITELREAIKIEPEHSRAYFNLGLCFLLKGDKETAMRFYQKALKIDHKTKEKKIKEHYKDLQDALTDHPEWEEKLQPVLNFLKKHLKEV
ncbi:MAG: Tetratricopeptide repeat protein [Candidatus Methanoperedenaceae archaeon GB50]|nr:MAG: Tetratricopeptide repeat protein [Candidatus Methanoperedenaceae archaeon GB50]